MKCEVKEQKERVRGKVKAGVEKRHKATMEVLVLQASGSGAPASLSEYQERRLELEKVKVEAIQKVGQGVNTRLDALWELMDAFFRREVGRGKEKEKEMEDKGKGKEKEKGSEMEMEIEMETEMEKEEAPVRAPVGVPVSS